ncbi:MAG: alpha/beta hydrolase [Actinobacteria bacterium]|nr:alpha/beta hydrolase [Actinomycetota bacterium]
MVACGSDAAVERASDAEAPTSGSSEAVSSPDPRLTPTVVWEPCEEPFECATVPVPVDHEVPEGETLDVALIRLPAPAAARRIGSLLVNPGGPGASGVDFVRHAAIETIPAELRARFDVVGFDPRGVGASRPVTCEAGSAGFLSHDLAPDDPAEAATVLAAAAMDSCGRSPPSCPPCPGSATSCSCRRVSRCRRTTAPGRSPK